MEVKPQHILYASMLAFALIVAASMISQYQSNAEFRDKWKALEPSKLLAIRVKRVAEENMEQAAPESEVESD